MLLNYAMVVALMALASWWLVESMARMRGIDPERRDRLDAEAAGVLLAFGAAGIALTGNHGLQLAGVLALAAGLVFGVSRLRPRRR